MEKLLAKMKPRVKNLCYAALAGGLAAINIPAIYELVSFGITYFPVAWA
jgi:hypothetical protein